MQYVDYNGCASLTTTRAVIHHEGFHSLEYRRKGRSCSNLCEIEYNGTAMYERIVKFAAVNSVPIAFVKMLHGHRFNICKDHPGHSCIN